MEGGAEDVATEGNKVVGDFVGSILEGAEVWTRGDGMLELTTEGDIEGISVCGAITHPKPGCQSDCIKYLLFRTIKLKFLFPNCRLQKSAISISVSLAECHPLPSKFVTVSAISCA